MKKRTSHENPAVPQGAIAATTCSLPIHCSYHAVLPASDLQPYPGNYRRHPEAQLNRYEEILIGNGWRRAIVVSKRSGFIVKGHGAYQTALRRGWSVPVEYQDYASESEEIRDIVADNRLAELAENDDKALAALLAQLQASELELAGVNPAELDELLAKLNADDPQLRTLAIPDPPTYAWALVAIPLNRFAEIRPHVEAIASIAGTHVETTVSDIEPKTAES